MTAIGCSSKKESAATQQTEAALTPGTTVEAIKAPVIGSSKSGVIASPVPKAVVYKMYGNAGAENVPVQMSPSGNGQVLSYPAPSDVVGQEPVALADGYLLDRRGVSANSRFLKWTYAEYGAMQQAPTPEELKAAIIPGAGVTDIHVLDMTTSQALADTAAVNAEIRKF